MRDTAVLIVDDDPDLRDLVRFVVEAADADLVEAATCCEAVSALQANGDRIRLVLLDYFMPGMEPAACAREVCRVAGTTLVVLCTAAANPAARAAEVGLSRWLAKPFELEALERLVREAALLTSPASSSRSRAARPR